MRAFGSACLTHSQNRPTQARLNALRLRAVPPCGVGAWAEGVCAAGGAELLSGGASR
jgi:hypothetical protein